MKRLTWIIVVFLLSVSCDPARIYEENVDLSEKAWMADDIKQFEFSITDRNIPYNLYLNLRNSVSYPYHNIYFRYWLITDTGDTVETELLSKDLFDQKTGQPFGSGIGDIFTHRLPLLEGYTFSEPGNFRIDLQQYMRMDTLEHVLSVGLRVESSEVLNDE